MKKRKIRLQICIILPFFILITYLLFFILSDKIKLNFNKHYTDFKFKNFNFSPPPAEEIIIIAIDDSSLKYFQENDVSYPWPRAFYAKALDFLNNSGAKAIFWDIIFNEKDLDRDEISSNMSDKMFASSLQKSKKSFLASQIIDDERFANIHYSNNINPSSINSKNIRSFAGIITPLDQFLQNNYTGFINVFPDSDGIIRTLLPIASVNKNLISCMFIEMYRYLSNKQNIKLNKHSLFFDDETIPLTRNEKFRISWYKKNSFRDIPFKAVIQSAIANEQHLDQTLSNDFFRDKIVFIGTTASGLLDNRATPISENLPGIEIWATAVSNLLQRNFILDTPLYINILLLLIITLITIKITFLENKHLQIFLTLSFILLLFGLDLLIWYQFHRITDFFSFIIAVITAFTVSQTANYFYENYTNKKMKRTFGRYLNANLVDYISNHYEEISLGGSEVEVSVLFTDIANFTTLSEGKKPTEIVNTLNEYFNDLTQFILKNNGLLDKYTGDGIMAVFGSPIPTKDHAFLACKAMMEYKEFCKKLQMKTNRTLVEDIHLNTRVAIHSGMAVTGNIGSQDRIDFTAIGDTVNLAARLEGVNKIYGTYYLISGETYSFVKNFYTCRKLDTITVKGKSNLTEVYELISSINEPKNVIFANYENALTLYEKGLFEEAIQILEKQLSDCPSKNLLNRINNIKYKKNTNWDYVLHLDKK